MMDFNTLFEEMKELGINPKIKDPHDLIPYPGNYNTHPEMQLQELGKGLNQAQKQYKNIVTWQEFIICGHGLVEAAIQEGKTRIIVNDRSDLSEEDAKKLLISDNASPYLAQPDPDKLEDLLKSLPSIEDIPGVNDDWLNTLDLSFDIQDLISEQEDRNSLAERFIIPPFSVFDTRQGYWVERRKTWLALIGDAGESRDHVLTKGQGGYESDLFETTRFTVSILDPVLSEVVNLWFTPKNSNTFDCFAGDTVFGFVSAFLGHTFTGVELREEQVQINQQRVDRANLSAKYFCDDGQNVSKYIKEESQDLLFSCPPYFDLEVYSELPNDASNQKEYADFLKIIENSFSSAIKCLKKNRFAVIVVGDIRNKKGFYRRFPDDIKRIFTQNGMYFYNDIILLQAIGSYRFTANAAFKNRKIMKIHQNVLVFYKGEPDAIKNEFSEISIDYTDIFQGISNDSE